MNSLNGISCLNFFKVSFLNFLIAGVIETKEEGEEDYLNKHKGSKGGKVGEEEDVDDGGSRREGDGEEEGEHEKVVTQKKVVKQEIDPIFADLLGELIGEDTDNEEEEEG